MNWGGYLLLLLLFLYSIRSTTVDRPTRASKLMSSSIAFFSTKKKTAEPDITICSTTSESRSSSAAPNKFGITVDKFMGVNAFVDDPIDKMKAVGFIREYHNWRWDEGDLQSYPGYPRNKIKWAPSYVSAFNFDIFYSKLKNADLEVSPVIQESVNWLPGAGHDAINKTKPLDEPSVSSVDPNSYEKKAHHMFQFAARYGANRVDERKLTLDESQHRKTGLGLIKYIEDWNEPDNDWSGPQVEFSPQEYAAMASANYDGHAGTMKQGTFGVKNADPKIKMVMGGIADLDLDYIKQMKTWFEKHRPDRKFAADVINVHHYAWKNGKNAHGGGPAKSPEEDNFAERLREIVAYRDQNLPGLEVWVSEFGWDTHPHSALRPPVVLPFDLEEVQGQWIVRAFLAFAAAGVDRAQLYRLRDGQYRSTQFATAGLTGPKGNWTPKKAWYYVYTMKSTLTNMTYAGEQSSCDPNILIYKFKEIDGPGGAYVVWAKTKNNYTVKGYSLVLNGRPTLAIRVDMVPGDIDGINSVLTINNNRVEVDVSERPVFIKVDDMKLE